MHRIIKAVRGSIVAWLALFVAGIAVAPPAASAYYCGDPNPLGEPCKELQIEALSPPIGSSFEEGQGGPWVMIAAHGLRFVHIYVAFSPQTGSDGHALSDLDRAGEFFFNESTTDEGVYTSYEGPPRLGAGTYYWQMEAGAVSEYQTPIYSFVVVPKAVLPSPAEAPPPASPPAPPPASPPAATPPVWSVTPTIPFARAYADVKSIIRRRTGHPAHHLSDSCTFDSRVVTCQASWTSAWPRSSRTLLYAGTFKLEPRSAGYQFSFSGRKKRYGCARPSGAKQCASKVHWRS